MKKLKTKPHHVGKKLKERAEQKKQIADRVKPEPKKNPNVQKRKFGSTYGEVRKSLGITLTAIQSAINARVLQTVPVLIEEGEPTGEMRNVLVKPSTKLKATRRESYVALGLIAPYPSANERRKVRRRNNRYAAVGGEIMPPKKTWHRVKKGA